MITKQDCLLLLSELNSTGVETSDKVRKVLSSPEIDLDVLKFIYDNKCLDIVNFYKKIRKSYNNKKSILYKNIVKELDEKDVQEVLTTLSSLQLQIFLYYKQAQNPEMFLKHSRAEEISSCLLDYSRTYSLINCINLLRLVKADLKVLETLYR